MIMISTKNYATFSNKRDDNEYVDASSLDRLGRLRVLCPSDICADAITIPTILDPGGHRDCDHPILEVDRRLG